MKGNSCRRRRRRTGSGRSGWSYSTLEDADFNFARIHDAQKLDVGLMRKIRMCADLRADRLPFFAANRELRVFDRNYEVRISGGDGDAFDNLALGQGNRFARSGGDTHSRGDFDGIAAIGVDSVDSASAHAPISLDAHLISGFRGYHRAHPGGDTARAVSTDFRNRAICIVQANAPRLGAGPGKELHTVGANARVARAKVPGQFCPISFGGCIFGHNQKIVAARVRFGKGNQSSSGSRKLSRALMAGSERSSPRIRSCCLLVATMVKLTRCRSPIAFVAKSASRSPALSMASRME